MGLAKVAVRRRSATSRRSRPRGAARRASTPWQKPCPSARPGVASTPSRRPRGRAATARLREAVIRFSNFGRDLVETRERGPRALRRPRPARAGHALPRRRARPARTPARRSAVACRGLRAAAGVDAGDRSWPSSPRRAGASPARGGSTSGALGSRPAARRASGGLGALVRRSRPGAVAHDQAVEASGPPRQRWLAPILIDARARAPALLGRPARGSDRDLPRARPGARRAHCRLCPGQALGQRAGARPRRRRPGLRGAVARAAEADAPQAGPPTCHRDGRRAHRAHALPADEPAFGGAVPARRNPAFDLVVFDEASQITVPDAIGAIARGKRCIVVGDPSRCRRPASSSAAPRTTRTRRRATSRASSTRRSRRACRISGCTGHYRSRHESLICFSNHPYYRGALVTYPVCRHRATPRSRFRRVDGVYAKGKTRTNAIEAKAVVAEVVRRLRDPSSQRSRSASSPSIPSSSGSSRTCSTRSGAPIPSSSASSATSRRGAGLRQEPRERAGRRARRDPALGRLRPDRAGRKTMSMNFGPLNRQGGERRLNVAITRRDHRGRGLRQLRRVDDRPHPNLGRGGAGPQALPRLRRPRPGRARRGDPRRRHERLRQRLRDGGRRAPAAHGLDGAHPDRRLEVPHRPRRRASGRARSIPRRRRVRRRDLPQLALGARSRPGAAHHPGASRLAALPDLVDRLLPRRRRPRWRRSTRSSGHCSRRTAFARRRWPRPPRSPPAPRSRRSPP